MVGGPLDAASCLWRREIEPDDADAGRRALAAAPVRPVARRRLGEEAWRLADELGWAKTYDAEYLALARLLDCRVLTVDGRMQRGAARLDLVPGPDELGLGG